MIFFKNSPEYSNIATGQIIVNKVGKVIKDTPILFAKEFKTKPRVFVTVESTTVNNAYGGVLAFCSDTSKTGFTLRVANITDAEITPEVSWVAIAK